MLEPERPRRAASLSPSRAGRAGEVTEEEFRDSLAEYPTIVLKSPGSIATELAAIGSLLENRAGKWQDRVEAMQRLKGIAAAALLKGEAETKAFVEALESLKGPLSKVARDLRSQVCREAACTIAFLAEKLGKGMEGVVEPVTLALITNTANSARVMASACSLALRWLIEFVHSQRILPVILSKSASKSKDQRQAVLQSLGKVLALWETETMGDVANLVPFLKAGLGDADMGCRVAARDAYKALKERCPEAAAGLFQSLDAKQQKALTGFPARSVSTADLAPSDSGRPRIARLMRSTSALDVSAVGKAVEKAVGKALAQAAKSPDHTAAFKTKPEKELKKTEAERSAKSPPASQPAQPLTPANIISRPPLAQLSSLSPCAWLREKMLKDMGYVVREVGAEEIWSELISEGLWEAGTKLALVEGPPQPLSDDDDSFHLAKENLEDGENSPPKASLLGSPLKVDWCSVSALQRGPANPSALLAGQQSHRWVRGLEAVTLSPGEAKALISTYVPSALNGAARPHTNLFIPAAAVDAYYGDDVAHGVAFLGDGLARVSRFYLSRLNLAGAERALEKAKKLLPKDTGPLTWTAESERWLMAPGKAAEGETAYLKVHAEWPSPKSLGEAPPEWLPLRVHLKTSAADPRIQSAQILDESRLLHSLHAALEANEASLWSRPGRSGEEFKASLSAFLTSGGGKAGEDFSEPLWSVLSGASNYAQLAEAWSELVRGLRESTFRPTVEGNNTTQAAHLVREAGARRLDNLPRAVDGSLPLRLSLDLGLYVLHRRLLRLLREAVPGDAWTSLLTAAAESGAELERLGRVSALCGAVRLLKERLHLSASTLAAQAREFAATCESGSEWKLQLRPSECGPVKANWSLHPGDVWRLAARSKPLRHSSNEFSLALSRHCPVPWAHVSAPQSHPFYLLQTFHKYSKY